MGICTSKLRALLIAAAVFAVWSGAWAQGRAVGGYSPARSQGRAVASGGYEMTAANLSADKRSAGYGERFSLSADVANIGDGRFPGGQIGAALVDGRGEVAEVVGVENHFGAIRPDERIRVNIGCAVSEGGAAAGRTYRLTVVVRAKGGSWESVSPSSGGVVPSLDFTVAAPAAQTVSTTPAAPPVATTPVAPPVATTLVAPPVAAPVAPPVATTPVAPPVVATTPAAPPVTAPAATPTTTPAATAPAAAPAKVKADENLWRKYVYKPQTVVKNIPQYSVEVKEYKVTVDGVNSYGENVAAKAENTTVFYILPKNITADTKVLYTMHGGNMEDDTFVKSLRYISETENIAVVSALYGAESKGVRAHPDRLFEDFVKRFNLKAQKYILFGFSMGAAFTSHFGQLSDSKYIDKVINHSPTPYLTELLCTDESFCPGAKKLAKYEDVILRNMQNRKTYIEVGSNENVELVEQAVKRFETAQAYSEAKNISLSWKFFVMEGAGHNVSNQTYPYIVDIIKGLVDENYTGNTKEVDLSNDQTPTAESVKKSAGKVIVEPLLKTQWTQGEPFNVLPDGRRASWIGCGTIAIAQIMKHHNHPKRGTGHSEPYLLSTSSKDKTKIEQPAVNFDVDYDWANMLDKYTAGATEQQRKAASTLTYHIAVSMRRDYMSGGGGVGEGPRSVEGSFVNFFGYDKSIVSISRGYCTDSAWAAIIRGQLNSGLPVYCHGVNKEGTGDHSFIIDGYDNKDKFHINWGWGGNYDGYYALDDWRPAGRGEVYNFNVGARITVNIQPNKGGVGSHEMALDAFTVGNTSAGPYEAFSVTARVASLGFFSGGQVGTALTDKQGNIVYVVDVKAFDALTLGGWRTYKADCVLKNNEKAGQYSLRIVTRLNGGEWKIVTLSDRNRNIPAAIDVTIKPPEPGAPAGGYGVGIIGFSTDKTSVSPYEQFTVTAVPKNFVSPDTAYSEYFGAALIDGGGNIAAVVGSIKIIALPADWSFSRTFKCAAPGIVKPGRYRLRIIVKAIGKDEWHVATMASSGVPTSIDFTVNPPAAPAPVGGYNLELVNFEPSKTSVSRKEPFAVKSRLKNVSPTETFPGGYLGVAIVDERGNILEILGTFSHRDKRAPGEVYDLKTIDCAVPEYVSPGRYKIRTIVKSNDNEEWRIATLAASGVPAVIDLTVER